LPRLDLADGGYKSLAISGHGNVVLPARIAEKMLELKASSVFSEAGQPMSNILKLYDRTLLDPFRKFNTAPWPSFHVRNTFTNMVNSSLDIGTAVLNPETRMQSIKMLRGQTKGMTIATKSGEILTGDQLWAEFIRYGGVNTLYRRAQVTTGSAVSELTSEVLMDLKSAAKYANPIALGRKLGTSIETDARLVHFLALRKDGLSPAVAMERVLKHLFDYDNLTPTERDVFKRVIPFFTWTKKNSVLQIETAIRKPGTLLNYWRFFNAMQTEKNPERVYVEKDLMPQYLKTEFGINVGPGTEAQTVKYLFGADMPQADLNLFMKHDMNTTIDNWIQMTGPLGPASDSLQALLGYDTELKTGVGESSPSYWLLKKTLDTPGMKSIVHYMGLHYGYDRQGRVNIQADPVKARRLAVLSIVSRPMREIARFVGPEDSWTSALARFFTGMRFAEFNPEDARRQRIDQAYTQVLDHVQKLRSQMNTGYIKEGIEPGSATEYGAQPKTGKPDAGE
jgi:hypothetical protein